MKKIFNFIRKPQFFGLSCIFVGAIMLGNIIDVDKYPTWLSIIYVVVFWTLISTGFHIVTLVDTKCKIEETIKCYEKYINKHISATKPTNTEGKKTVEVRSKDGSLEYTYEIDEE